jgi:hypothetical protein
LKLLELQRAVSGAWEVTPSYCPPLLQVGTSPFFAGLLENLSTLLENFRREVIMHLSDAYVARDRAAAVRRMVLEIQAFMCRLNDIEQRVYPHPYVLFSELRRLYFEVCCFFEAEPESELVPYHHDDPALSLDRMVQLLKTRLGHVRSRMRYCSFERQGGSFMIAPLPTELLSAQEARGRQVLAVLEGLMRAAYQFGLLSRIDARPAADEVQDVVDHLGHLLNMKKDYGSFVAGLGLAISDAMWSARPMVSLAAHIREQIEKFEPRLRDPRIEPEAIDDHFCPSFRIYGKIGQSSVRLTLSLHTVYCSVQVTQD